METILLFLLLFIFCLSNITCFLVGAKTGQKVVRGETIEEPKILHPVKTMEEYKENKKSQEIREEFNSALKELNEYDGY